MLERFRRSEILLGKSGLEKLFSARVAVFGLGGVGGYVVEALARAGVGALVLTDGDKVAPSNINRQIIALTGTVGEYKAEAFKKRIEEINPQCKVTAHNLFFLNSTADMFDFSEFSYVVDAIDTVSGKLAIIERAKKAGVPVISCMGAGNRIYADFEVADIEKTSGCPLARVMRRELKKRHISGVKAVFSRTEPKKSDGETIGSLPYVTAVAGLTAAGEVIRDLTGVG